MVCNAGNLHDFELFEVNEKLRLQMIVTGYEFGDQESSKSPKKANCIKSGKFFKNDKKSRNQCSAFL